MREVTSDELHRHADAIEHAAALGGFKDPDTGERRQLSLDGRAAWAADAAVLREAAHQLEQANA